MFATSVFTLEIVQTWKSDLEEGEKRNVAHIKRFLESDPVVQPPVRIEPLSSQPVVQPPPQPEHSLGTLPLGTHQQESVVHPPIIVIKRPVPVPSAVDQHPVPASDQRVPVPATAQLPRRSSRIRNPPVWAKDFTN
ncbi:hypothetical protein OS493_036980 [Desmophyllum pertusum]|uniref:Uncharacterized protein n=1 Tax=Desmophyllum pertusum TaxID=174260 RepID=A0A9W9YX77_9CNID|nr:hypothetical protein OS493_036980 [Desmophyllum pertusum]